MLPLVLQAAFLASVKPLKVTVDPRFELLAVTGWLSGKYPAPADTSYKLKVWNHFKKFRNHPAVDALRKSKNFYSDFTETGLDLVDLTSAKFKRTKRVQHWRTDVLGAASFDKFEANLANFVRVTGFKKFFTSSLRDYKSGVRDFEKLFEDSKLIEKLELFYRYGKERPRPTYEIFLEPLNGWGAHAIVDRFGDFPGDKTVRYQLGFWTAENLFLDSPLRVHSAGEMRNVAWHEASHVYIDPVFEKYSESYKKSERLFNKSMLVGQNIMTWKHCLNENIVRAIVAALVKQYDGEQAYRQEVSYQVDRVGFLYVGKLSEWITSEYIGSKKYKTFDDYYPVLIAHLDELQEPPK